MPRGDDASGGQGSGKLLLGAEGGVEVQFAHSILTIVQATALQIDLALPVFTGLAEPALHMRSALHARQNAAPARHLCLQLQAGIQTAVGLQLQTWSLQASTDQTPLFTCKLQLPLSLQGLTIDDAGQDLPLHLALPDGARGRDIHGNIGGDLPRYLRSKYLKGQLPQR